MKTQFTKLLTLSLCLFCFGVSSDAQDLTGIWKLKTSKVISGPNYANAVPKQMTVNQTPDKIEFKIISNLGDRDTVIKQMIAFKSINENLTQTGKKRLISFEKRDDHSWLKQTETFDKENPKKRQSIDEESYTVGKDGTRLTLNRKYDSNVDSSTGNVDFTVEAVYEKIAPELIVKETATGKGVNFIGGLNWGQVKAKAKAENKYIFVDCYATWCSPCKQMDKDVYPLNTVGEVMNGNFISVKVQMDSTKKDAEIIKQYYATAKELEKKYSIAGFPTYLFFSPDGEIVHKAMGFQNTDKFIELAKNVQLSEKQLYTQIKACREGKMDINIVPAFIRRLNESGDNAIALELARPYMKNYLEVLPEAKFAAKENLQFMWDFQQMSNSDDRIYKLCYEKPEIVNHIYDNPALADLWVENILKTEYISPAINSGSKNKREPDWKKISTALNKKSNAKHAENILIDSKHIWYCVIEDWDKACDFEIMRFQRKDLKKLPEDQVCSELNGIAWTLFEYCFNKKQLEQGLAWINEAVALDESNHKPDVARMDTKANLLYKLGRREEAIALQERAVSLMNVKDSELHVALNRMKHDEPTWEIGVKEKRQVK